MGHLFLFLWVNRPQKSADKRENLLFLLEGPKNEV